MNFVMKQALGGKINSFYSLHAHTNVTFCSHGHKSDGWNSFCLLLHVIDVFSFGGSQFIFYPPLPLTFSNTYFESLRSHAAALLRTLALREAN